MYLSDLATLNAILQTGANGFTDAIIANVLTYQVQAKVQVLRLLESSLGGQLAYRRSYQGSYSGVYRQGYSYNRNRREGARELYDELLEKEATDGPRTLVARAEALLCLHQALPFLNMRPTEKGGLIDEISGIETGARLVSPGRLEGYRRKIYNQAEALIEDALYEEGYESTVCHAL